MEIPMHSGQWFMKRWFLKVFAIQKTYIKLCLLGCGHLWSHGLHLNQLNFLVIRILPTNKQCFPPVVHEKKIFKVLFCFVCYIKLCPLRRGHLLPRDFIWTNLNLLAPRMFHAKCQCILASVSWEEFWFFNSSNLSLLLTCYYNIKVYFKSAVVKCIVAFKCSPSLSQLERKYKKEVKTAFKCRRSLSLVKWKYNKNVKTYLYTLCIFWNQTYTLCIFWNQTTWYLYFKRNYLCFFWVWYQHMVSVG